MRIMPAGIRFAVPGFIVLFTLLSTASAQTPELRRFGVRAGTGDAAFSAGWNDLKYVGNAGRTGMVLRGSGGYNATDHIAVLGEFQLARQNDPGGASSSGKLYGILLRYSRGAGRLYPYLSTGGGGIRESSANYQPARDADGWYFAAGGGVSYFLTRHWGVRPEFRYNRTSLDDMGTITKANLYQATAGIFFQFGSGASNASANSALASRSAFARKFGWLRSRNH